MAWKSVDHQAPDVWWTTAWESLDEIRDFYDAEWVTQTLSAAFAELARETRTATA